jgi:TolB-like protein/Flp pilus assembly protein TadD
MLAAALGVPRLMTTEDHREPLSSEVKRLEGEVGPHAHHPLLHVPVFEQLKQRNVFRVAVLYVVVCWLILDPVHVIFHMAGVPEWVNRLVLIVMAVGFPLVVIFAWVYEITPEGLKPTVDVPHDRSIRKLTGRRLDRAIIAVLAVALAYFIADKLWMSKRSASVGEAPAATQNAVPRAGTVPAAAAFTPPPHSIAVLPFVNMSGDKEQEYFSDGLSEELLNSLARINELQVAARTSSFYFKGEHADLGTIASRLNVASVLEGSVRRSGNTVRISAQLINAVTGFHAWSQTYDRDLGDVLKLQTEIANSVANGLKVALLGDVAGRIELGGTRNAAAFDSYLRATKASSTAHNTADLQSAVDAYSEAVRLDPHFALAFAGRAGALYRDADEWLSGAAARKRYEGAVADARQAIALAPELAEGHLALGSALEDGFFDFAHAAAEFTRAMELSPGNARVLQGYGSFAVDMGRMEPGLAAIRQAIVLDPLNTRIHAKLGEAYWAARRYDQAVAAFNDVIALDPQWSRARAWRGFAYYALGDFESARSSCEGQSEDAPWIWLCLAWVYHKLGRPAEAEAALARHQVKFGDMSAYQFSEIYAQWGDPARSREWLETAMRLRDPGLIWLKTDPFLDPVRKQPWFQAIERELKFPD